MPASPGSSLPPVWLWAISSFRSSDDEASSNSALGLVPIARSIALEAVFSSQISGLNATRKTSSSRAVRSDGGFRVGDREDLRHLLADRDVQRRGHEVGERERHRQRYPVRDRLAQRLLDQAGDGRLAEEADSQRGHRDAQLAGRQVLVDVVDLVRGQPGALLALRGHARRPWNRGRARARTRPPRRSRWRPPAPPRRSAAGAGSCEGRSPTSRRFAVAHPRNNDTLASPKVVDLPRQLEVGGGEPALGVGRDRDRHRVPRDRQVGVVAHLLGHRGDVVDQRPPSP